MPLLRRLDRANLRALLLAVAFAAFAVMLPGGCPAPSDPSSGVTAEVSLSVSQADPPLLLAVSGANSRSVNGDITGYQWDFAGQATADGITAQHLFTQPGRYEIKLTVTDSTGATASAVGVLRLRGAEPTAVITADASSGFVPLVVRFNGSSSSAPDDVVRDYFWDFGDGATSQRSNPDHTYTTPGVYTVQLTVTTGGGVSASTSTDITVNARPDASLLFTGTQFATLPVNQTGLSGFTFEAFFKPSAAGGRIVSFGNPSITVNVIPAENVIRITTPTAQFDAPVNITTAWQHFALAVDPNAVATIYVNGAARLEETITGPFNVTNLTIGSGYVGNITEVTFWSDARTAEEVLTDISFVPVAALPGLVGYWPFNEGQGQALASITGVPDGYLGESKNADNRDPGWSSDSP